MNSLIESSFTLARLIIREWEWLWAVVPIVIVAMFLLVRSYRQASAGAGPLRHVAATLKILGLLALAFFLLDPHWSEFRSQPRANLMLVLADNSRSLAVIDQDDEKPRGQSLRALLFGEAHAAIPIANSPDLDSTNQSDDESNQTESDSATTIESGVLINQWGVRLAEQFDTRAFLFDSRLRHLDQRGDLAFTGDASALMTSLQTLKKRYAGRPVAGILLLTDGNATDLPEGTLDLQGLPPIYPVVMGSDDEIADIRIDNLSVAQSAFEDAPVTIMADTRSHGFAGQSVVAQLIDADGKIVQQQTVEIDSDDKPTAFRFQLKPKKAGVSFYRLVVARPDDIGAIVLSESRKDTKSDGGEATFENNSRLISIDRGEGAYRILYVSGRPNWEYKFLSRAVVDAPQLDVVGLIRIAKREAKFTWRRKGENGSNPLFQGFDEKKKEEVEQYDEPVLVRMNTRDDAELRNGFPKSADQLFEYHAIIIDDLEAQFFTRDQMALLEKFVSRRRGGLLMLGGQETFREGGYQQTPIGRMLPVYLDRSQESLQGPFRFELTRAGRLEHWTRLRGSEADEQKRIAAMPGFRTINTVFGIKPGATTMATVRDDIGAVHPALVVQSFGGRVGVMTVGDQWRWALHRERGDDDERNNRLYDQARMWRQTLRWLVADVPAHVELSSDEASHAAGRARKLTVLVRDMEFQPVDNASVKLKVTPPDGKTIEITANAANEPGVYTNTYLPRLAGPYKVVASASDGESEPLGKSDIGWAQNPASDEFRSIKPNRSLLETIAEKTGGELIDADDLDVFVAGLPTKKSPVMEMSVEPLWDRWWVFTLALICFAGEWSIRRLKGLP